MKFISTKDPNTRFNLSESLLQGLAPDGGLFVPEFFPSSCPHDITDSLHDAAFQFLQKFFVNDTLESSLKGICEKTFNFSIPLKKLNEDINVIELFHGPTGAFKDVGARFLAQCFEELNENKTILVATSGDTGGAVASAFEGMKHTSVVILFPKSMISNFQEHQLTCWGHNILSLRIRGDFDSCQKMVKAAFTNTEMKNKYRLSSANSINIGRLLPQCVYYVTSSMEYHNIHHKYVNYIIPTGNMGNSLAAIWVKIMGYPIDKIILSCNANDTIPIYFSSHKFDAKPSVHTLANAMDVGNPSNLERFIDLNRQYADQLKNISAYTVSDDEIKSSIKKVYNKFNMVICPHTATAFHLQDKLNISDCIIVSTAHPIKFKDIVSPIINIELSVPTQLKNLLERETKFTEINPNLKDLELSLKLFLSER